MKCWYNLNIDNSFALRSELTDLNTAGEYLGFVSSDPLSRRILYQDDLANIVTYEWLEYMKSIDLEIGWGLIFFRKSNSTRPSAHKDCISSQLDHAMAINWCIGGEDSPMIWYNQPSTTGQERVLANHSTIDLYYTYYTEDQLVESDRHIIKNTPTLVRTDAIHNVYMGDLPRLSFSFRTKQRFTTWEDQLAFSQHLIV